VGPFGLFAIATTWSVSGVEDGGNSGIGTRRLVAALTSLAGLILLAIPFFSLGWRRCHDGDRPGALSLLCLVPVLGIAAVIVIGLLPPQPGGARFDEDGGEAASAANPGLAEPPPTSVTNPPSDSPVPPSADPPPPDPFA